MYANSLKESIFFMTFSLCYAVPAGRDEECVPLHHQGRRVEGEVEDPVRQVLVEKVAVLTQHFNQSVFRIRIILIRIRTRFRDDGSGSGSGSGQIPISFFLIFSV